MVLYADPTVPLGRVLGEVTARGDVVGEEGVGDEVADPIVIPSAAEAVFPLASFTTKVKVLVPDPVGVPDRTPVLANEGELRPVLQEPLQAVTAQV